MRFHGNGGRALKVLVASLAILAGSIALAGCENPALPDVSLAARGIPFESLKSGAYRGGMMLYSKSEANQLADGMIVRTRLARVEKDEAGRDYVDVAGSKRFGWIRIESVGLDGAVVSGTLYDEAGTRARSFSGLAVALDKGADLDGDGLADLRWKTTGRADLENARYLEFVCSRESGQVTMYELDPALYGGSLPFGVVSITPSGKFIINADANPKVQAMAKGLSPLPSFLSEGDVFIDASGSAVAGVSDDSGAKIAVPVTGIATPAVATPDTILVDDGNWQEYEEELDQAAVNFEVLDIDFNDRFIAVDGPALDKGTIDLVNARKSFDLDGNGTVSIGAKAGVRIDGSVKVRWLAVDYSASVGVYADAGVKLELSKTFSKEIGKEVTLVDAPPINVAIGGIPLAIRLGTVKAGYSFKASIAASATIECGFKAEAGVGVSGTMSVKNGCSSNFTDYYNRSSLVRASGAVTLSEVGEVYLAYEPSVTIAGILTPYASLKVFLREEGSVTGSVMPVSSVTTIVRMVPIYGPVVGPIVGGPIVFDPRVKVAASATAPTVGGTTGNTGITGYYEEITTTTASEIVPLGRVSASVDAGAAIKAGVRLGIDWTIDLWLTKIRIRLEKDFSGPYRDIAKVNILSASAGYFPRGETRFAKSSTSSVSGYVDSMTVSPVAGGAKVRVLFDGTLGKDNKLVVKDPSGKVLASYVGGLPCKADFAVPSVTLTLVSKSGGKPVVSATNAAAGMFTAYGYSLVPSVFIEMF